MINYFTLMNLMEAGSPAFDYAREAFNADFCAECGKIHFNKTTRKNGFSAFKNSGDFFLRDSNIEGLFCTPTSVIFLNNTTDLNTDGAREQDLQKSVGSIINSAFKKPVDFYALEDIALARSLNWKPNTTQKYYIEVEERFYDFNLVYNAINCIADGKRIDAFSVKRDEEDRYPVLMLRSGVGLACVLPFLSNAEEAYNVDFKHYMEFEKDLDDKMIQAEKAKWTA